MSSLYIPIRNSHPPESVSVPLSSLPTDPTDLIGVLTNELAAPSLWLRIALEYFYRGQTSSYLAVLSTITGEEATAAYSHPSVATPESREDRIAILCSLAGYETFAGYSSTIPHERQRFYQLAIEHLNQSTELDYTNAMTWIGKGLLLAVQGEWDDSLIQFNNAIANDRAKTNALAHIGKGICLYHKALFQQAARSFQQALQCNPQLHPSLMFGLGLCYYQGKDSTAAARVFAKILEKDEENPDALAALAVLELNEVAEMARQKAQASGGKAGEGVKQSAASVQHALSLFARAYASNPSHPLTLIHLASHFFYQQQYTKVYTLCMRALSVLDPSEHGLRCEVHYQLARSYHAQEDFASAMKEYQQARTENEEMQKRQLSIIKQPIPSSLLCSHPLVTLGLSQMFIHRGEYASARPLLLHLHTSYPLDFDCLRLLGAVHLRLRQWKEAEELLWKAVQIAEKDVELLCEWATACEQVEGKRAVGKDAYIKAVSLIREEHGKRPPFQLLHNIGVLCQEMGQAEEAKRWYGEALTALEEVGGEEEKMAMDEFSVASVTTRYNIALLNEQTNPRASLSSLTAPYEALLERFPSYLDASLRLGSLHQSHSSYPTALLHFQSVLQKQPNHLEGRTLLANFHVKRKDWKAAEKEYKRLATITATGKVRTEDHRGVSTGDEDDDEDQLKGDTYAKLALANLYHEQACILASAPEGAKLKDFLHLKVTSRMGKGVFTAGFWRERAGKYYRSVLESDGTNVYAAHGLACLLAEQQEWAAAKEVLMQVREAKEGYVDAVLNLAHIHCQQSQFAASVKAYEDVIDKLLPSPSQEGEEDEEVEERRTDCYTYLARAYYMGGMLNEAVQAMDAAIRRKGGNALLWYNRALTQEEYALAVLRKNKAERTATYEEVKKATERLEEAGRTFSMLLQAAKENPKVKMEKRREEKENKDIMEEEKKEEKTKQSDAIPSPALHVPIEISPTGQVVLPPISSLDISTCSFDLAEKAEAHAEYCKKISLMAAEHLKAAEVREEELGRIAEAARKAKEEAEERRRKEREEREQKEREERERAEEVARINKAKLAELQGEWITAKRREEEEEEADEMEEGERRKKKGKKKKGRASDEDGEEEEPSARKKRNKRRKTEEEQGEREGDAVEYGADGEERVAGEEAANEGEQAEEETSELQKWEEARTATMRARVLPMPDRESREGQKYREGQEDNTAESAVEDVEEEKTGEGRSRRGRIRRVEAEEVEVRGLDDETGMDEAEVRDEEGREAETEQVVAEAVEMRKAGRRKAIVEEEEEEEGGGQEGGEGAVEMNVTHSEENEAPINKEVVEEPPSHAQTEAERAEREGLETQTVSAAAMETGD